MFRVYRTPSTQIKTKPNHNDFMSHTDYTDYTNLISKLVNAMKQISQITHYFALVSFGMCTLGAADSCERSRCSHLCNP